MRSLKKILALTLCFHLICAINALGDDLDDDIPLDDESVSSIDSLRQDPNVLFKKQKAKTQAAINQKRQEQGMNDGRVSDSQSGSGSGGANVGGVNIGAGSQVKGDITIILQNVKDVNAISTK